MDESQQSLHSNDIVHSHSTHESCSSMKNVLTYCMYECGVGHLYIPGISPSIQPMGLYNQILVTMTIKVWVGPAL